MKKNLIITQNKYDECGNIFSEIRIDDQIWTQTNWVCPGPNTSYIESETDWNNAAESTKMWCYASGSTTEVLFSRQAMNDIVLPDGWRLPTMSDYCSLRNNVGSTTTDGSALVEGGSSGFEALTVGYRDDAGIYYDVDAVFWNTSTCSLPCRVRISSSSTSMCSDDPSPNFPSENYGLTIRLIKS